MDEQRQVERKLQHLRHMLALYRWCLGAAVLVIIVLTGLLLFTKAPRFGRAISISGKVVAMVRNEKAAAAVRERLLREAGGDGRGGLTLKEKWEDAARPVDGAEVLSISDAVALLRPKVTVLSEAFAIEHAGQTLVTVPSRETAGRVLDRLKARYASPSDAVVRFTDLRPRPSIRPCTAPLAEIVADESAAAERLSSTRAAQQTYTVQAGDYPDRIAAAHHMTLDDLWRLNPQLRGQSLRAGQAVTVLGRRAGLVVVTIKETVSSEPVPPPIERVPSAGMAPGTKKMLDPGKPGTRRVRWQITMNDEREVARRAISEEITREPVPGRLAVGAAP